MKDNNILNRKDSWLTPCHKASAERGKALVSLIAGLCLLAISGFGPNIRAETVRIIGDSLQSTPVGGLSITDHLRNHGWTVTCECHNGEALVGHSWRTDHIVEDTVVLALLTNDAGASTLLGLRNPWLSIYLHGVKHVVSRLVRNGKRVIFVLPTLTENNVWYSDEELHLFRWFAALVAWDQGAELLDMQKAGVPLAADGLHYDGTGTRIYAWHLDQQLRYGGR